MFKANPNELDFEYELGAAAMGKAPKKKKKKGKLRAKIKKGLKAVATGGLSLAVTSKAGKKVTKKLKTKIKGAQLGTKLKSAAQSLVQSRLSPAAATVNDISSTPASSCNCTNDLVKLTSAKVVSALGKPLDQANKILAMQQLQTQATYEHNKLVSDADFRRKVLTFIAGKAAGGNTSCAQTIQNIRSGVSSGPRVGLYQPVA